MKKIAILIFIIITTLAISASALLVEVDADDFAAGNDISTATDNMVVSAHISSEIELQPVYAIASAQIDGLLGSNVLGWENTADGELWPTGYWLRADFAIHLSFAAITIVAPYSGDVMLSAFSSSGGQLDYYMATSINPNTLKRMTVSSGAIDIAYIIVEARTHEKPIAIDALEVNFAPEPATIIFLGMGCLFIKKLRRP